MQVDIDCDGGIAVFPCRHQSCQERVLLSAVVGQGYSLDSRIGEMELFCDLPGAVAAAVIAQKEIAVRGGEAFGRQFVEHGEQDGNADIQYGFLVVAWYDYCKSRQRAVGCGLGIHGSDS